MDDVCWMARAVSCWKSSVALKRPRGTQGNGWTRQSSEPREQPTRFGAIIVLRSEHRGGGARVALAISQPWLTPQWGPRSHELPEWPSPCAAKSTGYVQPPGFSRQGFRKGWHSFPVTPSQEGGRKMETQISDKIRKMFTKR